MLFVTLQEDQQLRDNYWNETYCNKRIMMWDSTALPICTPMHQNTYSAYYASNVAKGAVFLQLCGWMGTAELSVGAVCGSDYIK
jgi:hypothetical protein